MNKYIDSEKLIGEIKRRINLISHGDAHPEVMKRVDGILKGYNSILSFIDSLLQEQPMPNSTQLIELWHADKEMLKEKDFRDDPWRLAYNAFMCGFGRGIAVKRQEQQEGHTRIEEQKGGCFYCVYFQGCHTAVWRNGQTCDLFEGK